MRRCTRARCGGGPASQSGERSRIADCQSRALAVSPWLRSNALELVVELALLDSGSSAARARASSSSETRAASGVPAAVRCAVSVASAPPPSSAARRAVRAAALAIARRARTRTRPEAEETRAAVPHARRPLRARRRAPRSRPGAGARRARAGRRRPGAWRRRCRAARRPRRVRVGREQRLAHEIERAFDVVGRSFAACAQPLDETLGIGVRPRVLLADAESDAEARLERRGPLEPFVDLARSRMPLRMAASIRVSAPWAESDEPSASAASAALAASSSRPGRRARSAASKSGSAVDAAR